MSCALVTGAAGFIGYHLCNHLQQHGIRVVALMRSEMAGPWDEVIECDLESPDINPARLDGVNTVFHLAGRVHELTEKGGEEEYARGNRDVTKYLLDLAKTAQIQRFIFFSSLSAMGEKTEGDQCPDEAAPRLPQSAYGRSKLAAERLVLESGIDHVSVLRPAMVYGPCCKGNLPRMIRAIKSGWFPALPEMHNRRSMVHVDDVLQAALLVAGQSKAAGQVYIITDGRTYSTRQMYEWICEALHKPISNLYSPMPVLKVLAFIGDCIGAVRGKRFVFDSSGLEKLTGSACYSSAKIEKELGFRATRNLKEALPEIVRSLGPAE